MKPSDKITVQQNTPEPIPWPLTLLVLFMAIISGVQITLLNAGGWQILFSTGISLALFLYALTTRLKQPQARKFCQYALALAVLVVVLALLLQGKG